MEAYACIKEIKALDPESMIQTLERAVALKV
jgi:hypothetical protein